MLDSSFVEALKSLAEKAAEPKVFENGDRQFVSFNGGDPVEHQEPIPKRCGRLDDARSIQQFATEKSVIFVNEKRVDLVLDWEDRREVFRWDLEYTYQFAAVATLREDKWLSQEAAMSFLRTELGMPKDSAIVQGLAVIQLKNSTETRSEIDDLEAVVGRDVTERSEGHQSMPQEFEIKIPEVMQRVEFESSIVARVKVKPKDALVCFLVSRDDIERIVDDTLQALMGQFTAMSDGVGFQVVRGSFGE